MISIIVPFYNEENHIGKCLISLCRQKYQDKEIIAVDDGSTDSSAKVAALFTKQKCRVTLIKSKHQGPAISRNLASSKARGDILVFADADMTFAPDFLEKLTRPIRNNKVTGTYTVEEFAGNWQNPLARSWNYFAGLENKRRISGQFKNSSPVFRAILKSEFDKVAGFDSIGYTDDWTLSRKLNYRAEKAPGAVIYHDNPENLADVYRQASWIGKNEFICGSSFRKLYYLLVFNPLYQLIRSLFLALKFREWRIIPLGLTYSSAVILSILGSFFNPSKIK